jgi:hypothetical protein
VSIFRRRDPVSFWRKARQWLSPRKGWQRGFQYLGRRVQRLPDSPHRIALGFACGVMASFTPFFGFHFMVAAAMAFAVRGNLLASAFGTFIGNPVTFPFIAGASLWLGKLITRERIPLPDPLSFGWLWQNLDKIFKPYLLGGLAPGLAAAVLAYLLIRPVIAAYQSRRRGKLVERAKQRLRQSAARRRRVGGRTDDAEEERR